jgi:hypothetical protein
MAASIELVFSLCIPRADVRSRMGDELAFPNKAVWDNLDSLFF